MKPNLAAVLLGGPLLLLSACSEPAPGGAADAPAPPPVAAAPAATTAAAGPVTGSSTPAGQAIDQAAWSAQAMTPDQKRNLLIRAQVLLARAGFSPGVVDGQDGDNLKDALTAFETAQGLPADGVMDAEAWARLSQGAGPVTSDYTVTQEDVAGPFAEKIPTKYEDMAKLEKLSFTTPSEALAEKFHMDEALLKALNPGVDFAAAGTKLLVVWPPLDRLTTPVTLVEVDKSKRQVRAFAADGKLVATYPATIGSSDMPTPSGSWDVTAVTFDPVWNYDPKKLNFGDKKAGKLTIKPGPNNPVGAVWIDLSKDTYGIHGAPEPRTVGKVASHGCVRLTNWDARQLASAVSKGTKVVFVGGGKAAQAKV
ncbi:L,D-transpeptidase [Phenylobacterium sp.]|jgi:lipoprotein-anchoring transpeptidase ErfK/SrfK|uniref:L,D-transpeptidase family protein n=1 Tax=Phenylobacterium sp. TaxID=1871053 RepID=UPI002F94731E